MQDYPELDYKYPMLVLKLILNFRSNFNNRFNYLIRQAGYFQSESLLRIVKFYGDYFHTVPTCAPKEIYVNEVVL